MARGTWGYAGMPGRDYPVHVYIEIEGRGQQVSSSMGHVSQMCYMLRKKKWLLQDDTLCVCCHQCYDSIQMVGRPEASRLSMSIWR
jgi:hypothetical protein